MRCRTDDGPSEEEIKKIVRTCMRKLGDQSNQHNSDNSYEDSNSDEDHDNRNNYNNNNNNRGNRFARHADMVDRWQQQQGYDNSYGNRNQQSYGNNDYYGNNGFDTGNNFQNAGNSNYGNNRNLSNRIGNHNRDQNNVQDKSCMVQCFFQEMKMVKFKTNLKRENYANDDLQLQTNNEGFPDKHKVIHIVTKDVRDREMKEFLMDSIQECFHIVEMERRREKCIFSKNIVSCLAERAKANCDDYSNETMIF